MDLEIVTRSRAGAKTGVDERPDIVRDDDYGETAATQGVPFLRIAYPPFCLLWIARPDQSCFHRLRLASALVASAAERPVRLVQDLAEEQLGALAASDCRRTAAGVFCSTICPWSMKMTRLATWRAKPISWVTQSMVMPLCGQLDHDFEHFLDHLGIERRGRLVEQHDARVHAQRRARSPRAAAGRPTAGRDISAPARGS